MKMLIDLTVDEFKNMVKNIVQECLKEHYIQENHTWQPYCHRPISPYEQNAVYCDAIDKEIKA